MINTYFSAQGKQRKLEPEYKYIYQEKMEQINDVSDRSINALTERSEIAPQKKKRSEIAKISLKKSDYSIRPCLGTILLGL